jgi:hypothetical protein
MITGSMERQDARLVVCYVDVMSIRRITISVPEEVAQRIKQAAGTTPVSTWVTDLVEERLDDAELERQWLAFYHDVSPSRADVRRAEATLRRLTRATRRRSAA